MRPVFAVPAESASFARRSGSTGRMRPFNTISPFLPHLFRADKGRVLGYDNAHGAHERHFMGEVKPLPFRGYPATARRFYREAEAIRRSYEDEGVSRRI